MLKADKSRTIMLSSACTIMVRMRKLELVRDAKVAIAAHRVENEMRNSPSKQRAANSSLYRVFSQSRRKQNSQSHPQARK